MNIINSLYKFFLNFYLRFKSTKAHDKYDNLDDEFDDNIL